MIHETINPLWCLLVSTNPHLFHYSVRAMPRGWLHLCPVAGIWHCLPAAWEARKRQINVIRGYVQRETSLCLPMAATTHKSHDWEEKSHHSFLRALGERAPSREEEGEETSPISTIEAAECGTSLERHGICGRRGGCRCRSLGLASSTSAAPTSSTTLGSIRSGTCWWFLDAFEVTSAGILWVPRTSICCFLDLTPGPVRSSTGLFPLLLVV